MSTPESGRKTLALRISPEVHAQLSFIAGLRQRTINDEGIASLASHLESAKADPDLLARAEAARQDVEREARERQEAISSMFDTPPRTTRGRKSASTD